EAEDLGRKICLFDFRFALGEYHGTLHRVLELADISRPWIGQQSIECLRRQRAWAAVVRRAGAAQERMRKRKDVLAPRAQRRHFDRHDLEPVVEVLTE